MRHFRNSWAHSKDFTMREIYRYYGSLRVESKTLFSWSSRSLTCRFKAYTTKRALFFESWLLQNLAMRQSKSCNNSIWNNNNNNNFKLNCSNSSRCNLLECRGIIIDNNRLNSMKPYVAHEDGFQNLNDGT
jgi:hypothetical protein